MNTIQDIINNVEAIADEVPCPDAIMLREAAGELRFGAAAIEVCEQVHEAQGWAGDDIRWAQVWRNVRAVACGDRQTLLRNPARGVTP